MATATQLQPMSKTTQYNVYVHNVTQEEHTHCTILYNVTYLISSYPPLEVEKIEQ